MFVLLCSLNFVARGLNFNLFLQLHGIDYTQFDSFEDNNCLFANLDIPLIARGLSWFVLQIILFVKIDY